MHLVWVLREMPCALQSTLVVVASWKSWQERTAGEEIKCMCMHLKRCKEDVAVRGTPLCRVDWGSARLGFRAWWVCGSCLRIVEVWEAGLVVGNWENLEDLAGSVVGAAWGCGVGCKLSQRHSKAESLVERTKGPELLVVYPSKLTNEGNSRSWEGEVLRALWGLLGQGDEV